MTHPSGCRLPNRAGFAVEQKPDAGLAASCLDVNGYNRIISGADCVTPDALILNDAKKIRLMRSTTLPEIERSN